MEDCGNMMRTVVHDDGLQFALPGGRFLFVLFFSEKQGADLAYTVFQKAFQLFFIAAHNHDTNNLSHFLFKVHLGKKKPGSLFGRQCRVFIRFHGILPSVIQVCDLIRSQSIVLIITFVPD